MAATHHCSPWIFGNDRTTAPPRYFRLARRVYSSGAPPSPGRHPHRGNRRVRAHHETPLRDLTRGPEQPAHRKCHRRRRRDHAPGVALPGGALERFDLADGPRSTPLPKAAPGSTWTATPWPDLLEGQLGAWRYRKDIGGQAFRRTPVMAVASSKMPRPALGATRMRRSVDKIRTKSGRRSRPCPRVALPARPSAGQRAAGTGPAGWSPGPSQHLQPDPAFAVVVAQMSIRPSRLRSTSQRVDR